MKKVKILAVSLASLFFFVFAVYAGTKAADVMSMNNKAYEKHTKGIIEFTHKKHITDYKIGCGECHHGADGKALSSLKEGDSVQGCIECHKKTGYITGKAAKDLSDKEKREYHANALHDNCIDCHKKYNRKNKTKAAPQTCTNCHPKK